MAMGAINNLFSRFGLTAKTKLLVLGSGGSLPESALNRIRSLNVEHVSSAGVMQREISRRRALGAADDAALAPWRRWFFARKPDAGFVLTDFPATLLQALVFDEWLDARDETLDAVFVAGASPALAPVILHYRTLGLLDEETGRDRAA